MRKRLIILAKLLCCVTLLWNTTSLALDKDDNKPYTVVVILEAAPGKEDALKQALLNVIKPSRAEQTNLEYRLHQDHNNHAQFIFYERWANKEAHAAQFKKPYIIELSNKIDKLLAKPYQVYFAEELE